LEIIHRFPRPHCLHNTFCQHLDWKSLQAYDFKLQSRGHETISSEKGIRMSGFLMRHL
jgi:hypothetical protein